MRLAARRSLALVLAPLGYLAGCLVGCGSAADFPVDDASSGGGNGGETSDGGTADDAGDDGAAPEIGPEVPIGACNTLRPGDTFVSPNDTGVATPPAAEGGPLFSGVYHLVSTDYYPSRSCARDPVATTLTIEAESASSGTLQLGTGVQGSTVLTESIRYVSAGTLLITHIDCSSYDPGGVQGSAAVLSYGATATEVRLLTHTPGCGYSVDTYQM